MKYRQLNYFYTHLLLLGFFTVGAFFLAHTSIYAIQLTNKTLILESPESAEHALASLPGYSVLTVSFEFDPYSEKLLSTYLPDGYITVNNQYNMTELVAKTFFYPLLDNTDLKVLVIDLNSLVPKANSRKVFYIKELIEKLSTYIYKNHHTSELALKFQYKPKTREIVDELWSFTSIPILISGVAITSGYEEFFDDTSKIPFLKKMKYLNLSDNRIGAESESFDKFLSYLKKMQQIEIIYLNNNSIGAINGSLKPFAKEITHLEQVYYLNLENNLIGEYTQDTEVFKNAIDKSKSLFVDLTYNLTAKN